MGKTISASQFKTFHSCNRQWAYNKVEDIPIEPNINMEIGNLVHRAIEIFNENHKPLSQYRVESSSTVEAMSSHIRKITKSDIFKNRDFNGFKNKMKKDDNTVYILNMLDNYVKNVFEDFKRLKDHEYFYESETNCFDQAFPTESELKLTVKNDDGSWFATSTIDAVYEKHPLFSYGTAIIDYKTTDLNDKCFADISSGHELQLKFYAWLYYQVYGVVPDVAGIHFVGSDPDEDYPIVLKDISFHDIVSTNYLIDDMKDRISSDDINDYEQNEEYQWCGEDYCDHYEYCLGDSEIPNDKTAGEFEGPDREAVTHELREPTYHNLTYASNSDAVL